MPTKTLTALQLAKKARTLAGDKKALDPLVLDLRDISSVSDFYVICSAESEPQLKALANHIEREIKDEHGIFPIATDGFPKSQWIIIDYGSVMVHIFHISKRPFYSLEDLWSDAKRVK
jgi:ribosome-associated protein